MKSFCRIRTIAFAGMIVAFTATLAQAQASRTWVSGVGDDANPCSRTAPCKTWAGAISKTAAGGEIDALDPGGFGAVTITKSITLDGGGFLASVLVSGTNGIVVSSATAIVHLRNLSIQGLTTGINGIEVPAVSQLHVERCVIASFSNAAINFHPSSGSLFVSDTTIMNNGNGGIVVATGRAMIENLHANANGSAVAVTGNAIATVRNSYAAGNATAFSAIVNAAAVINLESVVATHNTTAVSVNNGATARLSNCTIVSNGTNGLLNDGISNLVSMQRNSLLGNPVSNAFTQTVIKQ